MDSITAKINAIFDNDNDAWQDMILEVCAPAEPVVSMSTLGYSTLGHLIPSPFYPSCRIRFDPFS